MRMKTAGWLVMALVASSLCACGSGKQEASVALDEARLVVSSAKKAGAESSSPIRFGDAQSALASAEASFKKKKYSAARSSAQKASDAAQKAEMEAKTKLPFKAPTRAKRRAKR